MLNRQRSIIYNRKFKDFNVAVKSMKDTKVRQQQEVHRGRL